MGWKYIDKEKYAKFKATKISKIPGAPPQVEQRQSRSQVKHYSFDQKKLENLTKHLRQSHDDRVKIIEKA